VDTVTVGTVEVPVTGTIGGGRSEQAFCRLVQGAIRTRTVDLVAVGRCEYLRSEGCRCSLTGERHACLLLEDDPEVAPVWQVAWSSVEWRAGQRVEAVGG
jgi:hypothetical protein